jgi:hypothetical protein
MHAFHKRSLTAFAFAGALSVGVGGAIAGSDSADYGAAALVQAGHGPGGPPTTARALSARASNATWDYGSAAIIQLGHGPGGPRVLPPS